MPNIEYLLPNIGRTVPPGEPGSGESRGLGRGGEGVGSAFLRVPDAWSGAQLPCSCPRRWTGLWWGLLPLWGGPACLCAASSATQPLPPRAG